MSWSSSDDDYEPDDLLSKRIINALMQNDVTQLKQLREAGENFASFDEDNNTLLHLAILSKSERRLCDSGIKFEKSHLTRTEAFNYLLTLNEIYKDVRNDAGNTALMDVFMYLQDSPDWAIKMIKSGCGIYGEFDDGSTVLHWAVHNEWDTLVDLLIEKGFEVDYGNCDGETPLYLACKLGVTNIISMLLFYGADPNEGNCFDLVVKDCTKNEVKEIFGSLVDYERIFNLLTFVDAMEQSPELFYKLCDISDRIEYTEDELNELCSRLHRCQLELFKIFIQKYDFVVSDMFRLSRLENLGCPKKDKNELKIFATNIFTIFESDLVECVVPICNLQYRSIFTRSITTCLICCFHEHNDLDLLTQIIFCMLSYGVNVTDDFIDRIYHTLGYCSLFKMLLHMHITEMKFNNLVPRIFYDINLTPHKLIQYAKNSYRCFETDLHLIFDYFASPKLVQCWLEDYFKYMEEMKDADDYEMSDEELVIEDDKNEVHLKRVQRLPAVPKLVELARNKAREFIILKYKIRSYGQFYTIINRLPIAKIHKEILTFEKKLYE